MRESYRKRKREAAEAAGESQAAMGESYARWRAKHEREG